MCTTPSHMVSPFESHACFRETNHLKLEWDRCRAYGGVKPFGTHYIFIIVVQTEERTSAT